MAEAFERLVRRHRSEIFRTVLRLSRNREDAEDLTQITFLNAYTALLRGARPEAPRAWLHAIARNAGSRSYRQRRIVEVELDVPVRRKGGGPVPGGLEQGVCVREGVVRVRLGGASGSVA